MDDNQTDFSFLGNAYLDVEIIPGLHAKTTINGDILSQDYNAYYGTNFGEFGLVPPQPPASSTAINNSNNTYSWLNENTLDWDAKFGNHSLNVLAGYTAQKWYESIRSITGHRLCHRRDTLYIRRIYDHRYLQQQLLDAGIGARQGQLRLQQAVHSLPPPSAMTAVPVSALIKKYGTFPSVSGAWVLSDEKFFPKWNALSFVKFRRKLRSHR